MSRAKALTAVAVAGLWTLALGGCSYDYHQHSDRIGYRAGDAVKANLERETMDPARGSIFDTDGLGKNGSVQPQEPPSSTVDPP